MFLALMFTTLDLPESRLRSDVKKQEDAWRDFVSDI